MTAPVRILRNAGALIMSQPLTWALSLAFTVLVPRNVGPAEWGEWGVAWAIGLVARACLDLGLNMVLLKEVARRPEDAARQLGTAIALRVIAAPVLVLGMLVFAGLAGYPMHTRAIVLLVSFTLAVGYVGTPLVYGLQAFEQMHVPAIAGVLTNFLMVAGAVLLLKGLALGVVSIALVVLVANLAGVALQVVWLRRTVAVRLVFDVAAMRRMVRAGLPFYAGTLFFTVYVWVDAVMLSLLASKTEVGWYSAAVQVIAALGFLPYAVTTAVLPALARSFHTDAAASEGLASRSFLFVTALGLPMSIGLALVGPNLIATLFGAWFAPAGVTLAVLALTLVPVYVATLVNGFIVAADRQLQWTLVMGAMCVVNPLLNIVLIPYFHAHGGNASVGSALSLLATDALTGAMAVVLLPQSLRQAVAHVLPRVGRAAVAAGAMGLVVWPLRDAFVAIPIAAGVAVFVAAALCLRVFPPDDAGLLVALGRRQLARLGLGRPGKTVREAESAA